jgi:hypothetical protein
MHTMTSCFEINTCYETMDNNTLNTFVCKVLFIQYNQVTVSVGRTNETMVLPLSLRNGVERMASPYGEFSANCPW